MKKLAPPDFRLLACIGGLLLTLPVVAGEDEVRLVHYPRQADTDFKGTARFVVEDPDAQGGTAQAAIPGKSEPGSPICSFYSYARPAGIYRVIWRVKVDGNVLDEPVFRAAADRFSLEVKGTDFRAPNTYQEFTVTAEKDEGGFFAIVATWPGKGRVLVDSVTVVSEKLYTERELLEKRGGLAQPGVWIFPRPSPLRVHVAKGLWWSFFGLEEAMAELGGALVTSSYHGTAQAGTYLSQFPSTGQGLMRHHLVILANVDAPALRAQGRFLLEEYVRHGGALLVLGGPYALGPGQYRFTALERLLPVRLSSDQRLQAKEGWALAPVPGTEDILSPDLSWDLAPHLYYYHPVELKAGCRALVQAAGRPVVAVGDVGEGRVGVVAFTAEGDPPEGQLAFWEWGDMPRLVSDVCRWLVMPSREDRPAVLDEGVRKRLEQFVVPAPDEDAEARQGEFITLLSGCRDEAYSRELLSTVSHLEKDPGRAFIQSVAEAIRPYVREDFTDEAEELIESRAPGKASLGLQVLGLCRAPNAGDVLSRFLDPGAQALSSREQDDASGADASLDLGAGLDLGAEERLILGAVLGLGDLGDARYREDLRRTTGSFLQKRQEMMQVDDVPDLNENIYQQSLVARCRLGDPEAVGPLLDALLKDAEEIEQFQNALAIMILNKDDKLLLSMIEVGQIRLPVLYRRQAFCQEMLGRTPRVLAGAFATEISRHNHPLLSPFGLAALTPGPDRELDRAAVLDLMPLVRGCTVPELWRLPFRLAAGLGDPEVEGNLAAALLDLASGPDAPGARLALRVTPRWKPEVRRRVLDAALKHPSPEIQRLARLSMARPVHR
ncbi:MAG: hypothetical protein HYU36_08980 [Planctomycetes bacterium]|nr:hypothetical protein [Planctomycetota bacterium]